MVNEFTYGGPTILQSPIFVTVILPFLLVFTVVFAVLQKSEILGKGKRQIDALVALVVGLILIAFANAVGIIIQLTAFLGVSLVVILLFLILTGAFYEQGSFKLDNWVKKTGMAIVFVAVTIAVLYYTGALTSILGFFSGSGNGPAWIINIIVFIIIIAAVAAVIFGSKDGSSKKE